MNRILCLLVSFGCSDLFAQALKPPNAGPAELAAPFDKAAAGKAQRAWGARLNCEVEETNSIGMKLVLIPPGEFRMGSPETDEEAFSNERPQHSVRLTRAYLLGKYEVTQGEYQQVMGVNPAYFSEKGPGSSKTTGQDTSRFPVEMVSWLDAAKFCNKLSEKEKLPAHYKIDGDTVTVSGVSGYRLPTEAEWEYACRAGTTTKFWNGDDAAKLGEAAWFSENSKKRPHNVGETLPNAFGLHDMHGNVLEWCWDLDGSYGSGAAVDPQGMAEGSSRVSRGGPWNVGAKFCRGSFRTSGATDYRNGHLGFRVLRVPLPSQ